jgi:hypothetical protein
VEVSHTVVLAQAAKLDRVAMINLHSHTIAAYSHQPRQLRSEGSARVVQTTVAVVHVVPPPHLYKCFGRPCVLPRRAKRAERLPMMKESVHTHALHTGGKRDA